MKRRMYCCYDKATRSHMNPLVFVNHGEAVRWFRTVVNTKGEGNNISLYPHQFMLVFLGFYDDVTGKFENEYETVMEGTSVVNETRKFTVEELMDMLDKRYGFVDKLESGGKH
mgnify:CR=1 FL=1